MNSQRLLTIQEAANYLGIPVSTLRHYRDKGKAPTAHKIGGRVYFTKTNLDSWLASKEEER